MYITSLVDSEPPPVPQQQGHALALTRPEVVPLKNPSSPPILSVHHGLEEAA